MHSKNGFTFIELILYVAIIALLLTALVPFAWNIIQTSAKSSVQQEVSANARYIVERIAYEIRNASEVNSVSATTISLATTTPATNPTVVEFSSGVVTIQQGSGSAEPLHSANTVVTGLTFSDLSSIDNATQHISFALTLAASFAAARQEYQHSVVIETSTELRSN